MRLRRRSGLSFLTLFICCALVAGGCAGARRFVTSSGDAERAAKEAEAAFKAGRALVAELRFDDAAKKLSPLINTFHIAGNEARAAEAAFWTAYCHEKLGRLDQARTFYHLVVEEYPSAPVSRQAAARFARIKPE